MLSASRRAVTLRIRLSGTRSVSWSSTAAGAASAAGRWTGCGAGGAVSRTAASSAAASTSARTIRPPGPDPVTALRSTPFSRAIRRASGEDGGRERPFAGSAAGAAATGRGASCGSGAGSAATGRAAGAGAPSVTSVAIGVPMAAVSPSPTRISPRTPSSYASYSIRALSVSMSTSASPAETLSPGFLCQELTTPSSIVSDRRGMRISDMVFLSARGGAERVAHGGDEGIGRRQRGEFQGLGVGERHLGHRHPAYGRVEPVEGALLDRGRDLGADPVGEPVVLGDHGAPRTADGADHGLAVERAQAAQVDDLGGDALAGEPLGDLGGDVRHPGVGDDRDVGALAGDGGPADLGGRGLGPGPPPGGVHRGGLQAQEPAGVAPSRPWHRGSPRPPGWARGPSAR